MITKFLKYIIILCPIFTYADASQLAEKINQILESNEARRLNFSIQVNNLKTGEEIYSLNPYKSMTPASTTKSFTAYAALEFLKPDFTYTTDILFDKTKINSDGILSGDLYIKFSGDPSLTRQELAQLISKLKSYNIKEIDGNIIIDDSIFDQGYQAPGWPWDDSKFCFAAPTSAIVINKNCFYLNLSPGVAKNDLSKLSSSSKYFVTIRNEIMTEKNQKCSPELEAHPDNSYDLTGCIDIKSERIPLSIAYQNPRLMIEPLINKLLTKQNIKINGKTLFNPTPSEYKVMLQHKSKTLDILVKDMMKISDNIAADNFIKTIGAHYYKTQGNFANGVKAIKEILSNTNIDSSQIRLFDGSGGSRYNLIAADQLVQLYTAAYNNKDIYSYFYNSLPISATDGRLEKKLTHSDLHGKINAKTGTMAGVSCLSGYLTKDENQILVFAIMINGHAEKSYINKIMEQILVELAQ